MVFASLTVFGTKEVVAVIENDKRAGQLNCLALLLFL